MREIDKIVIHCAATKPGMNIGVKKIREWHVNERGWRDIGYHTVITRDGTIQRGRPIEMAGAHARGYNKSSIGICLVGGMDKDGKAAVNYTDAQWESLLLVVAGYEKLYPNAFVCGHNDLTKSKTCPNFDAKDWYGKAKAGL